MRWSECKSLDTRCVELKRYQTPLCSRLGVVGIDAPDPPPPLPQDCGMNEVQCAQWVWREPVAAAVLALTPYSVLAGRPHVTCADRTEHGRDQ